MKVNIRNLILRIVRLTVFGFVFSQYTFGIDVDSFFADAESSYAKTGDDAKDTLELSNGEVYENYEVSRVEPDGITISYAKGVAKIPFTNLPPEFAERYNYDAKDAEEYSAAMEEKRSAWAKRQKRALEPSSNSGVTYKKKKVTCPVCNGRGKIQSGMIRGDVHTSYYSCSKCRGTGKITKTIEKKSRPSGATSSGSGDCVTCDGSGVVYESFILGVWVPYKSPRRDLGFRKAKCKDCGG